MRRRTLAFSLVLTLLFVASNAFSQIREVRRVLIVNDLNTLSSPGFALTNQAIVAGLQKSPYQIELYSENLETTLFPDEAWQRDLREWLLRKYVDRKPDVIIAVGRASVQFVVESQEKSFPGIPVIFCGSTEVALKQLKADSHVTGVWAVAQPEKTLEAALRLQPGTKHVVVVGGVGAFDRDAETVVRESLRNYESKFDFTYLTELDMPTLLGRLKQLPSDTIVFHTSMMEDAAGTHFIDASQSVPMIADASNAPVFVMDDVDLRDGTVGGNLLSWAATGQVAAGNAVRILNGEKPQDIPIVKSANIPMFDWRALRHWGMKETALPPDSIVLNRQPTFWDLYRQYMLLGIFVLLAQSTAILGLLWQRRQRRKTEADLRRSEEKFAKSFRHSPLAISLTTTKDDHYIEVNETFEQLTGWTRAEVTGQGPREIKLWVDCKERIDFVKQLLEKGNVQDLEVRICRKDGQIRTMLGSSELIDFGGERCGLSVFTDITERKQAEEALAGVSRRLIEAQEQERTRIARELHDDINQRVAMLAVELSQLQQSTPDSALEIRKRIDGLQRHLSEISVDVQAISHRLHSSKLEFLGLVVACKSFCREVAERNKVTVDFTAEDVPPDLAQDISLCLFRILQESLNNAIKHSGVRHFEVRLRGIANEVGLTVRDCGVGFDAETAVRSQGIGLISMRERASLVKGTVLITSKPMGGTEISVRVPMASKSAREMTIGVA